MPPPLPSSSLPPLLERRNFWKMHVDRNSMVTVLLQHVADTKKFASPQIQKLLLSGDTSQLSPYPPLDTRPSLFAGGAGGSRASTIRNIMGLNYFNREVMPAELVVHSRFYHFPETEPSVATEDGAAFRLSAHDGGSGGGGGSGGMRVISSLSKTGVAKKARHLRAKHRNLSQHLVNFSASPDCTKAAINMSSIQTFMSVSDTQDALTASCCLIAISNISAMPHARTIIMEINMVHKFPQIISFTRGSTVSMAAALLYYYFSIDSESEDRIYSLCSNLLSTNGLASNGSPLELQIMTLYTLSNLMPCIDRQRLTEIIMSIVKQYTSVGQQDALEGEEKPGFNQPMAMIYLPLILGMCMFSNTHSTLIANDILEIFSEAVDYAVAEKDHEVGLYVAKILLSFLSSNYDSPVAHLVATDSNFIFIFEQLLEMKNNNVLRYAMRCLTVMSGFNTLVDTVTDGSIIAVVAKMIQSREILPHDIALDVAKYFSNICQPFSKDYLVRLVEEDCVQVAILGLMDKCQDNAAVQTFSVRGLQNILSSAVNCASLAKDCLGPLMRIVKNNHDAVAVRAVYNISCLPELMDLLAGNGVHVTMLNLLAVTASMEVKVLYLEVMMQLSTRLDCINDLMSANLIQKFADEISGGNNSTVTDTAPLWPNAVTVLLMLVNCREKDLSEGDRETVVGILKIICQKKTPPKIIGQASVVLAYLSLSLESFVEVDAVMRSILSISNNETVMESVSTTLYNVTCSEKNASILLADSVYINIMIKIMRNGKPEVQLNIARAMRTLCSLSRCTELLLSSSSSSSSSSANPATAYLTPREGSGRDSALSDLIVIALLRTSSEDIKVVCSEAFYNMLCHRETRLRLIKGDLWWAMTKLSKNDSERVRIAGIRALYDLSCDASYIVPLRDHHVLSFLQEIGCSGGGSEGFLDSLMRGFINVARQFSGNLASHEILASVRLAVEALRKCTSPKTVQFAVALLLKCARQHEEFPESEFVQQDLATVLHDCRHVWGDDAICRVYVSRICWLMTKSSFLTGRIALQDLAHILLEAYSDNPSAEICENVCGTIIHYISHDRAKPETVVELQVMWDMIGDAFSCERYGGGRPGGEEKSTKKILGAAPYSLECRALVLSLVAYVVHLLVSPLHKIEQGRHISQALVKSMLTTQHLLSPVMRDNLLLIVLHLSFLSEYAAYVFDEGLINVLLADMDTYTFANEAMNQYCSACLRNMALHKDLVPRLLSTPNSAIDRLIQRLLEMTTSTDVCIDICIFMFCAVSYKLQNEFVINSKFCLNLTSAIGDITKDPLVSRINKFVVGEILEKYSSGVGVNPAYVQAMYTEMLAGSSLSVQTEMAAVEPKILAFIAHVLPTALLDAKAVAEVNFEILDEVSDMWHPYLERDIKKMNTEMLRSGENVEETIKPLVFEELLATETFPMQPWSKIVKDYPPVGLPEDAEFDLLADGEEDEGDDDDDDDDEATTEQKDEVGKAFSGV